MGDWGKIVVLFSVRRQTKFLWDLTVGTNYVCLWELQVRPGMEPEFERHYGPTGTWEQLFRCSPHFIETLLLRDKAVPGRYLTLDRWHSENAFHAFRSAFALRYAQLDKECEQLTVSERSLGAYAA